MRSYAVRLEAEYQAFVQGMNQAAKAADKVGDSAEKASQRVERATKAQADAAGRLRAAEAALAQARAKQPADAAQVVAAEERVAKARRDVDKATQEVQAAEAAHRAAMGQTEAAASRQTATLGKLTASVEKNRESWDRAGTALTAFGAITTATMGATVKAAMDWESAWTGVQKTVDGTPKQMAAVEESLRGLAKTLPASHQEIAAVAEAAGQLGVALPQISSFTKTMIDLGETTNLSAEDAATAIAQMANVMDPSLLRSGDGVQRLGATLVALGNDGASTERQIMEMAQRISGAGALVGASTDEVLALASSLASMGVTAELGGGVASRVLQDLYTAVQSGGDQLQGFAQVAGMSAEDFASAFQADPVRALATFSAGLNNVESSGGNVVKTLMDLGFRSTEEQRVLLQLKSNSDLLVDSLGTANQAWQENAALLAEAEQRYDTAEAKVQIARNAIVDAGITIGQTLLPALASGAEGVASLATAFGELPEWAQRGIGSIGGLVGVTSLAAGGFLLLFPRVMDTVSAFRDLSVTAPRAQKALAWTGKAGGMAVGLMALATALNAMHEASMDALPSVEQITKMILDAEGIAGAEQAFSGISDTFDDMKGAADRLIDGGFNAWVDRSLGGLVPWTTATEKAADAYEALGQSLATIYDSDPALAERLFREAMERTGRTREELLRILPPYADALASSDNAQKLAGDSAEGLATDLEQVDPAIQQATDALEDWREMVAESDQSFVSLGDAWQSVIDKNREAAEAAAEASSSSKDSWEDFYDGTTVSMGDWIAQLEKQAEAQQKWRDNLLTATQQIRDEMPVGMQTAADKMIDSLIEMGTEGAPLLQEFVNASADERQRLVDAWAGTGGDITAELEAARAPVITVEGDTGPLQMSVADILSQIQDASGVITVEGDMGPAGQALSGLVAEIDDASGTVTIRGEDGKAVTTLRDYTAEVNEASGAVTIRGTDSEGRQTVVSLTDWITDQDGSVRVNANTAPARQSIFADLSGLAVTVAVKASVSSAVAAVNRAFGQGYTGGRVGELMGYASGGQPSAGLLPGTPPADPREDNLLGVTDRGDLIKVRSREFIQSQPAVDYYGVGFMEALNQRRIPKDLFDAAPGFASGGAVYRGHTLGYWQTKLMSSLEMAQTRQRIRDLETDIRGVKGKQEGLKGIDREVAMLQLQQAKQDLADAQYADKIGGGHANAARNIARRIAQEEQAKEREQERREAARAAQRRQSDMGLSLSRGEIREQATSGLSGAQSIVDQLRSYARDDTLSASARGRLGRVQGDVERQFSGLYGQLEKVNAQLDAATDKMSELREISDATANAMRSDFSLVGAVGDLNTVTTTEKSNQWGESWTETTGGKATKQGLIAAARERADRIKSLAGKIQKLVSKGFSAEIIQEVGEAGVDGGTELADVLLTMSAADVRALNGAYTDIDRYASQAGQNVTTATSKGGLAGAMKEVAQLTGQQGRIESQIASIGKAVERVLGQVFGIKGYASGGNFPGDRPILVGEEGPEIIYPQKPGFVLNADATRRLATATLTAQATRNLAYATANPGASGAGSVRVTLDRGALAQAMDGTSLTLSIDGQPVRAVIDARIGSHQAAQDRQANIVGSI